MLAGPGGRVEIEQNILNKKLKTICAYYGKLEMIKNKKNNLPTYLLPFKIMDQRMKNNHIFTALLFAHYFKHCCLHNTQIQI
jgi:hypothetical protein